MIYKKIVKPLIDRSRLIKQGVVFLNNSIVGEIMAIAKNKNKNPFMPIFSAINVEILKQRVEYLKSQVNAFLAEL